MTVKVELPTPRQPYLESGLLPADFYAYEELLSEPEREKILNGSGHRPIRALQGNLTGIAYVEVPNGGRHERHPQQRRRARSASGSLFAGPSRAGRLSLTPTGAAGPQRRRFDAIGIVREPMRRECCSLAWAARSTMESLVSEGESGARGFKRRIRHEECDVMVH